MGVTAELAPFTAGIWLDRLPPEVVQRARFLVLDLVGNIVRARHDAESTPSLLAAARALGLAAGNNGVFGDSRALHAGGCRLPERRPRPLARLRRHACGRLAASGRSRSSRPRWRPAKWSARGARDVLAGHRRGI